MRTLRLHGLVGVLPVLVRALQERCTKCPMSGMCRAAEGVEEDVFFLDLLGEEGLMEKFIGRVADVCQNNGLLVKTLAGVCEFDFQTYELHVSQPFVAGVEAGL